MGRLRQPHSKRSLSAEPVSKSPGDCKPFEEAAASEGFRSFGTESAPLGFFILAARGACPWVCRPISARQKSPNFERNCLEASTRWPSGDGSDNRLGTDKCPSSSTSTSTPQYSFLVSTVKLPELPSRVRERGMNAVALTDLGNMFGAVKHWKECKAAGIQPIVGCELNVAQNRRHPRRPSRPPRRIGRRLQEPHPVGLARIRRRLGPNRADGDARGRCGAREGTSLRSQVASAALPRKRFANTERTLERRSWANLPVSSTGVRSSSNLQDHEASRAIGRQRSARLERPRPPRVAGGRHEQRPVRQPRGR